MSKLGLNNIGVMTIPKAGTFYMMSVLDHLGYDIKPIQIRPSGNGYNWEEDSNVVIRKLQSSVVCGHVGPGRTPKDWKIIFMHRDLKECCISLARWCKQTRQWGYVPDTTGPELTEYVMIKYIERYAKMVERVLPWLEDPSCLVFNYNDKISHLEPLANYLGESVSKVTKAHELALETNTRTSNTTHSVVEQNWSYKCDMIFKEYLGGYNERLEKTYSST